MKLSVVFLLVFSMMVLTSGLRFRVRRFRSGYHTGFRSGFRPGYRPGYRSGFRPIYRRFYFPFFKRCPHGWTKINGRCFHYVAYSMTWANAEKNCLSMGANLASVRNADEYRRVQRLIRVAGWNSRPTWLGGSDAQQERTWLWSDGRPMRYTNWCGGEPNNAGGNQNCLQMNFSGAKCWDDFWCNHGLPSVCAKKL